MHTINSKNHIGTDENPAYGAVVDGTDENPAYGAVADGTNENPAYENPYENPTYVAVTNGNTGSDDYADMFEIASLKSTGEQEPVYEVA